MIMEFVWQNVGSNATDEQRLATLKADKEELEAALAKEELQRHQLKQELTESEARNVELTKATISSSFSTLPFLLFSSLYFHKQYIMSHS